VGEAQQSEPGTGSGDQTEGEAAEAGLTESGAPGGQASDTALVDAEAADPASEAADTTSEAADTAPVAGGEAADAGAGTAGGSAADMGPDGAGGENQIWDVLPPEVEYPLRPNEVADATAPGRAEAWRRRTAAGALFTGFALGLREVLEPDRNEPAIMMETSGVPPKDLPVEADIDQVPPRQSVVKIRRWLLPAGGDKTSDATADKRIAADKER
jgi:hypothetical protein